MRSLQKNLHNPPTASYAPDNGQMDICVTTGSQEGLCKVSAKPPVAPACFLSFGLFAFISPHFRCLRCWSNQVTTFSWMHLRILAHLQRWDHFYSTPKHEFNLDSTSWPPLPQLQPLGCNLINVPSDHHGMIPSALKDILSRWDPLEVHKPSSTAPKVLYTIPNGGNPTGASMTTDRKQEVYKVGSLHLVVRAAYFLLMRFYFFSWPSSTTCLSSRTTHTTSCSSTKYRRPHLFFAILTVKGERCRLIWISVFWPASWQPWAPSFLSMDVDGRIIRMDSFSKILSSGWEPLFIFNPSCARAWWSADLCCVCLRFSVFRTFTFMLHSCFSC